MPETKKTTTLIVGSGPAGYTAGIYLARAGIDVTLVEGLSPGGQLTVAQEIENFPGFKKISGLDLMEKMKDQALGMGVNIVSDIVTQVDFSSRPFSCTLDSGDVYESKAVIVATGARARWLDLPSEDKYRNYGVSACATCDGYFFKDKDVFVVGGGNTAIDEAMFLTRMAKTVTVIHRRNELRAEKVMQDRLFSSPKVKVIWDSVVHEVLGTEEPKKKMTGLVVENVKTGAFSEHPGDALFIAIGHVPNTSLVEGQIMVDEENYIMTQPGSTRTSVSGVFAAGDVQDKIYRQGVMAAGSGCMAAVDVQHFLQMEE